MSRQEGRSVEDLVLDSFARRGRPGLFAENWLWSCLFGLVFWDVVFSPIAGAFQHAFQTAPLDLYSTAFRKRRSLQVEQRIVEVQRGSWPASRLLARFDEKEGIRNSLVPWSPTLRDAVERVMAIVDGPRLASILDRLSRDPGRYRRGIPDLFVSRPDQRPGFELLEVKAPGDQLRPHQRAWIDYLNEEGIPASVVRVEWG